MTSSTTPLSVASTTSTTSTSSLSHSPLSTAAAIGGGVGGGLGGAILILGVVFLLLRHRKNKEDNLLNPQSQQGVTSFYYAKSNKTDLSSTYELGRQDSQHMNPMLESRHELPVS
ncbi:hypothetical protein EJ08DRAFT_697753 [Tothia fuscella]|uniref:Uncharacterized protein n=1 Tax=Tothia fuscella TaxID=1048955 RepID=A0A9P4NRF6_9PEZI|nr:hypothetical protein EJ08DRAFT_697753 [Tothia fuscella]